MNFLSLFILIFISTIYSEVPNNNYLWPTNKNKTITTLFGETRSRRFHAGIDVRTFGEIGGKIFAIESGYISRIKISSDGYGKAIYLKLNDVNTVLFAHLDKYFILLSAIITTITSDGLRRALTLAILPSFKRLCFFINIFLNNIRNLF